MTTAENRANTPDMAGYRAETDPNGKTLEIEANPVAERTDAVVPPSDQIAAPEVAPEPKGPAPYVDPRIAIAEAQKARRKQEAEALKGQVDDSAANANREAGLADVDALLDEPERPAQPQAEELAKPEASPAAETYELKVRGQTFKATRDQLVELAGLTPEESQGLPLPTLIRAAQTMEASRSYMTEARDALSKAKNTPRTANEGYDPAPGSEEQADRERNPTDPQRPSNIKDVLAASIEKVQFAPKEEAADALAEAVNLLMEQREQRRTVEQVVAQTETSIDSFLAENQDFVQPINRSFLIASATEVLKDSLSEVLGVDRSKVEAVIGLNPERANQAYSEAIANGVKMPAPKDILTAAANRVRTAMGATRPTTPSTPPAPQVSQSAIDQRTAAKRAAPQPSRSGSVAEIPASQTSNRPTSTSAAIQRMRSIYGR